MCNAAYAAENEGNQKLWRPRMITPSLVALDSPVNREFTAEVRASPAAKDWHIAIANDLKSWNCEVVSSQFTKINRGTEPGWLVRARVPADASPELFDLTVASSDGSSAQNQAVSVSPVFATDFYILHLADEQIVNDQHTDPSGQYFRTAGTVDVLRWLHQPINLIHPRFVFITGDQIDYNGALDG
ncbi:MAG: hypothetical protein JWM57_1443, partial [Phycisphaerales bacterium]|nr:hypothetical protein [Phycisphaerales bacterium]